MVPEDRKSTIKIERRGKGWMVLLEGGEWYSKAEMEVAFDVARMKLKGGSGTRGVGKNERKKDE